jgi:hypothetical protein
VHARSPLARLSDRQHGALLLVLGTALLFSPLYLTALLVGPPSYTYRTAPVHVDGGEVVVEGIDDDDRVTGRIAGIDCTADGYFESRACALDQRIVASGPVPVEEASEGGPRYVRVDGTYYRRVVRERNGTEYLGLERVTAREALDGAAIPRFALTWPGRVALFAGGVTTTYPLTHAEHVVETTDGYRLVYLTSFNSAGGGGQSVFYLLGVLTGGWLVVRGYRRLPADEGRSEGG